MQLPVQNLNGEVVSQAEVHDLVFGIVPNHAVMHQALVRQQANMRSGTHNTLTRAHVSGGGKKPWRQKGTGRARQGSIRAPQWRGGGVVFGPHPRKYTQKMPRKMRRLATRSMLSQKVIEQRLVLLQGLPAIEPRTKAMVSALQALRLNGSSALIATNGRNEAAERAGGNLPNIKVIHASNLSMADMLKYDYLFLDLDAVAPLQSVLLDGVNEENARAKMARAVDGVAETPAPNGRGVGSATVAAAHALDEGATSDTVTYASVRRATETEERPVASTEVPEAMARAVEPATVGDAETMDRAVAEESIRPAAAARAAEAEPHVEALDVVAAPSAMDTTTASESEPSSPPADEAPFVVRRERRNEEEGE